MYQMTIWRRFILLWDLDFGKNNPMSPFISYFLAPLLSEFSVQWKIPRKGRKKPFVNGCCVTLSLIIVSWHLACRSLSQTTTVWYFTGKTIQTFIDLRAGCDAIYLRRIGCLHTRARQHQRLFTEPLCFNPVKLLGLKRWGSLSLE